MIHFGICVITGPNDISQYQLSWRKLLARSNTRCSNCMCWQQDHQLPDTPPACSGSWYEHKEGSSRQKPQWPACFAHIFEQICPAMGTDLPAELCSVTHAAVQPLCPLRCGVCLQDAADVEFAVHSLAPNEAANGVAVSHGPAVPVPAADNTSAAMLPGAEVTSGRFIRCDGWTTL